MVQTTNIRRILDRVTRHKMMRDIPFETAIEYTVDFLSLMGTPAMFDEKTAIVEIKDWRGMLPCDFDKMNQVRVAPVQHNRAWNGCPSIIGLPAYRYADNSFHMSNVKPTASAIGELTYMTQNMVIFTSTKDVDVEISYRAFATDAEGYPLLPDNTSFLRGLEAYIKMKWFEQKYDAGEISEKVMERADREYCWAAGDAQSEFSRLDLDKAETLFNSFKTLLPRNNEHVRGFATAGAKEIWK